MVFNCGEVVGSTFLGVVRGDLTGDDEEEEESLEEEDEEEDAEDEFLRLCFGSRTLGRPENVMMQGYQSKEKEKKR